MEKITITRKEDGYLVEQGDKITEMLGWDEMLGLIASLTMLEPRPCLHWMNKKEKPYEPKDGDFVWFHYDGLLDYIGIYMDKASHYHTYCQLSNLSNAKIELGGVPCLNCDMIRPATEEEKQLLLDAMHKAGKDWDAEKKEVVEYCWKPKDGETYYYCLDPWSTLHYVPCETKFYGNNECDVTRVKSGNCFQTKEQCFVYCKSLSEKTKKIE